MGVAFAAMWASAFTSARVIAVSAPPLATLSLRFLISGVLAVGLARALGQSWRLDRPRLVAVAGFGLAQNTAYLGLNFVAMQWIEASLAVVIASSLPLWVAAAAALFLGERPGRLTLAGLALGFAGVIAVMAARIGAGVDLTGLALAVLGVMALTAATLLVRGASAGGDLLMIVGLQMLVGAASLGVLAGLFEPWRPVEVTPRLALAFAYTTLVPGLAATLTWFALVRRIGAVRAASFHFLNPFLGVATAALVLGEALGPADIAGVAVIMAGILAVQRGRIRTAAGGG